MSEQFKPGQKVQTEDYGVGTVMGVLNFANDAMFRVEVFEGADPSEPGFPIHEVLQFARQLSPVVDKRAAPEAEGTDSDPADLRLTLATIADILTEYPADEPQRPESAFVGDTAYETWLVATGQWEVARRIRWVLAKQRERDEEI